MLVAKCNADPTIQERHLVNHTIFFPQRRNRFLTETQKAAFICLLRLDSSTTHLPAGCEHKIELVIS